MDKEPPRSSCYNSQDCEIVRLNGLASGGRESLSGYFHLRSNFGWELSESLRLKLVLHEKTSRMKKFGIQQMCKTLDLKL